MAFRLVWFWRYELLWLHSDNHLHAVVEHALEPPRPLVHRAASSLDGLTMSCRVREVLHLDVREVLHLTR